MNIWKVLKYIDYLLQDDKVSTEIWLFENTYTTYINHLFPTQDGIKAATVLEFVNSSTPGQNGNYFANNVFKCIFMDEKICFF